MTKPPPLSDDEFKELLKNGPLVSIDLIVKNSKDEILLGYRKNAPAKNYWFVPGGRIWKNESLNEAFKRITLNELGKEIEKKDATFVNVTQHLYDENKFEIKGLSTHYVVITFQIDNFEATQLNEDEQHLKFKWFKLDDLISSKDVHQNTKDHLLLKTIPADSGLYGALMSHYIHYDALFWSHTQIILAIQTAGLIGSYQIKDPLLSSLVMGLTILLTIMILGLIHRDISNCRINEFMMDQIASKIVGIPKIIRLRSNIHRLLSGRYIIHYIIGLLLIINIVLLFLYAFRSNLFFGCL